MMNYEIASGHGTVEYGGGGFIGGIDGKALDTPKFATRDDSRLLQGYATRYNEPLIHDYKIKILAKGALDRSLSSNREVRFLLDHNEGQCIGSTRDCLELFSDEYGLAFRFRFPDTVLGRKVKLLAANKDRTACSIGYDSGVTDIREIDGTPVVYIKEARLNEISLVSSGAVKRAYAVLKEPAKCKPLRDECASNIILHDGSYVGVQRAFRKLQQAFETRG